MTCKVVLSAKEFRKFTFFDIIRRRKMYKSPVTFSLILLISALICFLLHDIEGAIMLGTLLLVVGLGVPAVYFSTFHLSLNKQVKLQSLKEPRQVYTVSLSRGTSGRAAIKPAEARHPKAFTLCIVTSRITGVSAFTGNASWQNNSGSLSPAISKR